jgi:conjugative relaxase-like TrwC/TraI family protein
MLTISSALNTGQAATYHKLDYASSTQSYYQQGEEVKGEWRGELAASLGLSGEVSSLTFNRLAEGQHPETGEQLVKHRDALEYKNPDGSTTKAVEHRAGWDAQFAPSKSVSLTALVGGDEGVRDAHREAVGVALAELERFTQARIGGNNPAETTGKFVAATFEHDTARPVDGYAAPQLHTHAVIFNVTERADGSTRALQERAFFESQNYVTAVYQAELFQRLKNLGYEIEAGTSGAPEIKGYSAEYLAASSPRSAQIREHMEKAGFTGPGAAQIAAHATREAKQDLTPGQVLSAHRDLAATYGNQHEAVISAARNRAQENRISPEPSSQAREAMTYAKAHSFEREAVADERVILRDALRRGMGDVTAAEIRAEFQTRQKAGEFRSVESPKYASAGRYTTPVTIAQERANINHVLQGKYTVTSITTAAMAEEQANARGFLNDSQRRVVEDILTSRDRVHGLQGLAGTGKTTTLETIREGAEKSGYTVEGFAPTSKASGQLREAGITAGTLQSFLQRTKPTDPDARHLYLLDESSLASSKQMRQFLDKIGPQDHIVVIGDIRQHQGVEAGRPFQQMQDAGMRTSLLDQIVRQKDPELLRAVEYLAKNETERGVGLLREQGRVTEIPSGPERIQAIARDYASKPESTIIISPDNKSRQQLNEAVRVELKEKGVLSSHAETFRTLTNRNDMTGAERTWAARYEVGNILQYTTGSKAEGIAKDSFATVQSVDTAGNRLTVELENGKAVSYDPKRLRGVNAYRESSKEFASGDRIQFTTNDKKLDIRNRDLATIVSAAPGQITVRMDGKAERSVTFDPTKLRQFDHGYAVTSHSSQGLTQDRVLANFDTGTARSLVNTRLAYVAVSRASQDARIYTNDADSLGKRLSVDISKTAAIEISRAEVKSELRQAVEGLRAGKTDVPIDKLKTQGRVYQHAQPAERISAVAKEYAATKDRTVVLSERQSDRAAITAQIRTELQQARRLSPDRADLATVLREQHFKQAGRAADYKPGDVIQYGKGSPKHGLLPKTEATVEAVDSRRNLIVVRTGQDDLVTYSPARLKTPANDSKVYRPEQQAISQGERIRITRTEKELNVRAGDFATVTRTENKGGLKVRLDSGKEIDLTPKQARHVEHGYAIESGRRVSAERFIVTGDTTEAKSLKSIPAKARDLSIHTTAPAAQQQKVPERVKAPQHEQAQKPPQRDIQRGYGIGLSL